MHHVNGVYDILYYAKVLVRIIIMHLIPCSFSMSKEGQHILKEVQREFMES